MAIILLNVAWSVQPCFTALFQFLNICTWSLEITEAEVFAFDEAKILPILPPIPLAFCQLVLYVFQSLLNNAKVFLDSSTELVIVLNIPTFFLNPANIPPPNARVPMGVNAVDNSTAAFAKSTNHLITSDDTSVLDHSWAEADNLSREY